MNTETTETMELVPEGETIPTKQLAPFDSFKERIEKLKKTAETLVVTDVNDKVGMALARTTRLAYKDIRVEITHRHKELKADILEEGNRLDKAKRDMLATIETLEERLLLQEQFAQRKADEELAAKIQHRTEQLVKFWNPALPLPDLGALTVDQFDTVLSDAETTHNAKIAAAAKVEADRIAKEKAEAEERERVRLENVRLKEEAAQREAASKKEREKQEAEQQQREDALSEIKGIQQQVIIARMGRAGVRKGGTVECIRETLQETEKWDISENRFGGLTSAAQSAKDSACAAIRDMFANEIRRIGEEEKAKDELARKTKIEDCMEAIREGETDALRICKTAKEVREEIEYVEKRSVTEDVFQERLKEAVKLKATVLFSMRSILKQREDAEALKAKRDAEDAKRKAELVAAKKAAKAPDRDKLLAMADTISHLQLPTMATDEGSAVLSSARAQLHAIVKQLKERAQSL